MIDKNYIQGVTEGMDLGQNTRRLVEEILGLHQLKLFDFLNALTKVMESKGINIPTSGGTDSAEPEPESELDAHTQGLVTEILELNQLKLFEFVGALTKVMESKGITVGATIGGPSATAEAAEEQEKKEFKLKVVNVDGADRLKAAKLVQELFEKGGKPIQKLIEASKMIAVATVFDLNPIPAAEAEEWLSKFAELGVVMEKV
jgi:ribosomal protein L7/L12